MCLDSTDLQIIKELQENSRLQWKELGQKVHLTGQAAADRVRRLEDSGVITGYSVSVDENKLGNTTHAIIHVFLSSPCHASFQTFIAARPQIRSAHRISGQGCYILTALFKDSEALNKLLDDLLPFGNYQLNLSIQKIK